MLQSTFIFLQPPLDVEALSKLATEAENDEEDTFDFDDNLGNHDQESVNSHISHFFDEVPFSEEDDGSSYNPGSRLVVTVLAFLISLSLTSFSKDCNPLIKAQRELPVDMRRVCQAIQRRNSRRTNCPFSRKMKSLIMKKSMFATSTLVS